MSVHETAKYTFWMRLKAQEAPEVLSQAGRATDVQREV